MIDYIKLALRITGDDFDMELNSLIAACLLDLKNAGVICIDTDNDLMRLAISLFCKANFGENEHRTQFNLSYGKLKTALSIAGDYNGGYVNNSD